MNIDEASQKKKNLNEENNEKQENERARNGSDIIQDSSVNEECNSFNDCNSTLSPVVIKEKINKVLHCASLPLIEDGTPESLLYQSWHNTYDNITNCPLPEDFFSVEHILQRERELTKTENHFLKTLMDLLESAVPSQKLKSVKLQKPDTVPKSDLSALADYQAERRLAATSPRDNFGKNSEPPSFLSPHNSLVASGQPVSNHLTQFDLNSLKSGIAPVTSALHLPPENQQSELQNAKPSVNEPCRYCIATYKFPQDHDKKECPKLACMKPCKVCNASGNQNHTLMHCPFKKKVVLKLKGCKRNDGNTDNEDDKNVKNIEED